MGRLLEIYHNLTETKLQCIKKKKRNYEKRKITYICEIYGSRYSRMDQLKFVEDSLQKIRSDMVCFGRPYHFKFLKGCLPQILLSPISNTLTHIRLLYHNGTCLLLFGKIILQGFVISCD